MKTYVMTVVLEIPVILDASSKEEAVEMAMEDYSDWLDEAEIDDVIIHKEK